MSVDIIEALADADQADSLEPHASRESLGHRAGGQAGRHDQRVRLLGSRLYDVRTTAPSTVSGAVQDT